MTDELIAEGVALLAAFDDLGIRVRDDGEYSMAERDALREWAGDNARALIDAARLSPGGRDAMSADPVTPLEPTGLSESERDFLSQCNQIWLTDGNVGGGSLAKLLSLVDRLSDQGVPEGHTRIDGKLWRLSEYSATLYRLVEP